MTEFTFSPPEATMMSETGDAWVEALDAARAELEERDAKLDEREEALKGTQEDYRRSRPREATDGRPNAL